MNKIIKILMVFLMSATITGCSTMNETEIKDGSKIAGNVAYFDENNNFRCEKKIITIEDGMFSSIDEYKQDLKDVTYLSDNLVIYPGLIDLHSHTESNMYQLFTDEVSLDELWDNRFEWRKSNEYFTVYKEPNNLLSEKYEQTISEDTNSLTYGQMIYLYSELQAVAGGTTLLQEDNNSYQNYLDWHRAIKTIRSTSDNEDLGTSDNKAIESVIQLYTPDRDMGPEVPSSYTPHQVTNWSIKNQKASNSDLSYIENMIQEIKEGNGAHGYLIHLAEGRNGNLNTELGMDEYCRTEFEQFKSDIESYVEEGVVTKQQIIDSNITLIHACGIDLSNESNYNFVKEYGITLLWSPVSNLLLYGDTPNFYDYLDDEEINIVIGSDWSPSGSKTVWDECKFAFNFISAREDRDLTKLKESILKAVTIDAANAVGLDKLGNIKVGNYADFMIMDTSSDDALDSFYNASEKDVSAVYVGGRVTYAGENYINTYLNSDDYDWFTTNESTDSSIETKYYNLTDICDLDTFKSNYETFIEYINEIYGPISSLRDYEDLKYQETIKELTDQYCK